MGKTLPAAPLVRAPGTLAAGATWGTGLLRRPGPYDLLEKGETDEKVVSQWRLGGD